MLHFFSSHKRKLRPFLLGLLALILYTYYYASNNEIYPLGAGHSGNRRPLIEIFQEPSKTSSDNVTLYSPSKNTTMETNLSSVAQSPTVLIGSQQPASISDGSTDLQSDANETVVTQKTSKTIDKTSSTGNATIVTIPVRNNSVRAIYIPGHDVTVPERCPKNGSEVVLAIVIMSAPSHVEARTAIRQTWGSYGNRRDVTVVFALGSTMDKKLSESLKQEEILYGDVIRGRYVDSYSNLTLKTISSLEWIKIYCSKVKFFLKTDDDMFINVPRLLMLIKKYKKSKNVILGRVAANWKPIRNKKSKYYVSKEQYDKTVFPNFTTGPAYLMSRDVVEKLYETALDQTYLKLEDVFVTGIVAQKLGVKRLHVAEFFNTRTRQNPCQVQRGISLHMVTFSEQFDLWKKSLDGKTKCR